MEAHMKFYVTDKYEIIDPAGAYEKLSEEKQSNLLYDAMDIYEKNFGQKKGSAWPKVVVRKGSAKDSLGEIKA
jgi:hypothetical protein